MQNYCSIIMTFKFGKIRNRKTRINRAIRKTIEHDTRTYDFLLKLSSRTKQLNSYLQTLFKYLPPRLKVLTYNDKSWWHFFMFEL